MPTTSNITISTVIKWLIYLVPIYIFLIAPGLRVLYPATEKQSKHANPTFGRFEFDDEADYDQLVPGLRVEDDSFISPEEDLDQVKCREDDYRVHIFSHKPLIIYVENFFTHAEADHLVAARSVLALFLFSYPRGRLLMTMYTVKASGPHPSSPTVPPNESIYPSVGLTARSSIATT